MFKYNPRKPRKFVTNCSCEACGTLRATLVALTGVLVTLCTLAYVAGCSSLQRAPDTAARDAYVFAKKACAVYELAPASKHTSEMDRTCRSLRLVCE